MILDVSCGPGDYSVAWTSQIARLLPKGIAFYCTDYPGGISKVSGETYAMATAKKVQAAAVNGKLKLAQLPVPTDADLLSVATMRLCRSAKQPTSSIGRTADIMCSMRSVPPGTILGRSKRVCKQPLIRCGQPSTKGVYCFPSHETRDNSDGIRSQLGPVSRKYCGRLDDVPAHIAARIGQLSGYEAVVNFASPLKFPGLGDADWERLKQRAQWDRLNVSEARALRLLNFIANDFLDPTKAARETHAEDGRLASYVDEFKSIVTATGGYIVVKCAFQMISKLQQVARKLDDIALQLTRRMREFSEEMAAEMRR